MHDVGYVPCTRFVLYVVEEEELVFQLCHQSEKLAIAFGLIKALPPSMVHMTIILPKLHTLSLKCRIIPWNS
jgi:hypothetical protein